MRRRLEFSAQELFRAADMQGWDAKAYVLEAIARLPPARRAEWLDIVRAKPDFSPGAPYLGEFGEDLRRYLEKSTP